MQKAHRHEGVVGLAGFDAILTASSSQQIEPRDAVGLAPGCEVCRLQLRPTHRQLMELRKEDITPDDIAAVLR